MCTIVVVLQLLQGCNKQAKTNEQVGTTFDMTCPTNPLTIASIMAPSNDRGSEHYRRAHARDGINEMHPEVLNRRISSQESGEMEAAAERAGMRVRRIPVETKPRFLPGI